ncbi:glycosyl transferase [Rhodobacterales bacterium HKCCE2091]|nr:glycosyl transferase [Rhodobacterales bacterium HKCCE2091]
MSTNNGGRRPRKLVADRRTAATQRRTAASGSGSGGSGGSGGTRKPKRRRSARPARRRGLIGGLFHFVWRVIWGALWRGTVVVALLVAASTAYIYAQLPDVEDAADDRIRGSVTFLDRDGQLFARRGSQFGGVAHSGEISPHLVHALVATEDRRFYWHPGVDPIGITTAMLINMREGRSPFSGHGGSSLAQQVAKLMCLGVPYDAQTWPTEAEYEADCRRTTIWRKVQEVPWALALTARYGREGVLTVYLNRAYYGNGFYGVSAAMEGYFGTSPEDATPQQAAMLAGLLTAPSRYAPTSNLERSQGRANVVIRLMQRSGFLTRAEADAAISNPATLGAAARFARGGYFADWIMSEGPDFLTDDTTEDVILRTTFDPELQAYAEDAVERIFASSVREGSEAQAAVVIMSPDGAVRAMVGGRDFDASGLFNRATQARRQPGSSFKPFIYAAALDQGWRFDDLIYDGPLTIDVPGSGPYSPQNYSREFYGEVMLVDALRSSLNTAAVRLSETVGREEVFRVAEGFGIETDRSVGPAIALGTSEVTLIDLTGAYAGILNQGTRIDPYGVEELRFAGDDTPLFQEEAVAGEQVITPEAARQLVYMMSRVVANGTGQRAQIDGWQVAGKTGTTQSARDAWFVGFTADYVAGVWMGYDDNTPLSGVTGGGLPADIWREAMAPVHAGLSPQPLPMIDPAEMPRPVPQVQGTQRPDLGDQILMEVLQQVLGDLGGR